MDHPELVARYLKEPGVEIGAFKTPIPGIKPTYVDRFPIYAGEPTLADYYGDACDLPFLDSTLGDAASWHVLEHVANPLGEPDHDLPLEVRRREGREGPQILVCSAKPFARRVADVMGKPGGKGIDRGRRRGLGAPRVGKGKEAAGGKRQAGSLKSHGKRFAFPGSTG